ncbi:MBL fold metallo-hydrolase [Nocardia aurea]|uniref:MBL fold metallo-hydrolase n=1 Tax=Nocardia aurea TaxID=2144174 RepID=UPI000D6A030A|nr:MBL fold metallo-hydrolase [Nocardia aurea]
MPATPAPLTVRERLSTPPRLRTLRFGRFRLTYIPDGYVALKPRGWITGATEADWTAHADYFNPDGHLVAGLGGLLVQRGRRAILIDAGAGPVVLPDVHENPMTGEMRSGALLDSLSQIDGLDRIEGIAVTHLHFDHLGWTLTPVPGRTPFATAPIYLGEVEWAWWRSLTPAMIDTLPAWAKPSILTRPILDTIAPRVKVVHHGTRIFPGVRAVTLPGHTTGHTGYELRSCGKRMLVFGDVFHSPIQITHPEWAVGADYDQAEAIAHREQLVADLASSGDLAFGIHFADVPFGRVHRDLTTGRTTWVPAD